MYRLDNFSGVSDAVVIFDGTTGNTLAHTLSVYIRGVGSARLSFSATGGNIVTALTAEYERRTFSGPGALTITDRFRIVVSAGSVAWFIVNQMEEGAFAGSEIVVAGAAATRAEGAATAVPDGSLPFPGYNPDEGSFIVEYDAALMADWTSARTLFELNDGTTSNRLLLFHESGIRMKFGSGVDGGWNSGPLVLMSQTDFSGPHRVAVAYGAGELVISVDGSAPVTLAKGLPAGLTQLSLGQRFAIQHLNGSIAVLSYFPTRLPDARLQALSA